MQAHSSANAKSQHNFVHYSWPMTSHTRDEANKSMPTNYRLADCFRSECVITSRPRRMLQHTCILVSHILCHSRMVDKNL